MMPKNIASLLTDMATKYRRKKFIFFKDKTYTYSDVESITNKISRYLVSVGLKRGERVALLMENSPEFVFSLFGIQKAGGVVVPVNTFLKDKEVSYIVDNSEACMIFTSAKFEPMLKPVRKACATLKKVFSFSDGCESWGAENIVSHLKDISTKPLNLSLEPSSLALIVYTSGTTGSPKGAMLTHENIISDVHITSECYSMNNKDRILILLPMFHIISLQAGIMFSTILGASMVILESVMDLKKKSFKRILIFKRPTLMVAVPSIYAALAKAQIPKWFVKFIYPIKIHLCSGSALPVEVFNAFKAKYLKPLIEGYGLSETSAVLTGNTLDNPIPSSVGKPLGCMQARIVDNDEVEVPRGTVGEIIASGPNVMQGYWKMPKETHDVLRNGWFFTGDLGYMDNDGNVYIVDRKKDLILVKGMNVYPREIEELIYQIPEVELAAVIGIPDDDASETIVAFIKLVPDAVLSEKDIKSFLKKGLANFKQPKHVYFNDELPLTSTGKVLKRKLKEMILSGEMKLA